MNRNEPPDHLVAVARRFLLPESAADIADAPEPTADEQAVSAARSHRMLGLVVADLDRRGRLDTETHAPLLDAHADDLRRCLVAERVLVDVMRTLEPLDIRPLVLKGVGLAHLAYPDPAMRTFQDLDLLVPADRIDDVVRALGDGGAVRDLCERRPGWDRRFSKDITFDHRFGVEVDLHRTLATGAFGFWFDARRFASEPVSFTVGGVTCTAPTAEARALHAAFSLGVAEASPRLCHAVDLALSLRQADVDGFVELLEASRAALVVLTALDRVQSWMALPELDELQARIRTLPVGRAERAALRAYRSAGGSNTATLLSGVIGMATWGARVEYLRGLIRPSADYRSARRMSHRPREFATGLRELLGRSR